MVKWLQWRASCSFLHISSIFFGSCDCLQSGTREWIFILRTRHSKLPNTKRPFWSMLRMYTVPNIDMCQSISTNAYWAAISSPPQRLQDPVNHPLIHMICQVVIRSTQHLTMWLRWHPAEVIGQHLYWPPPCSIQIRHLKHQGSGGNLFQISMITAQTKWRSAVHFGNRTWPTAGVNTRQLSECTLITPMWHLTYSLSYHMVSEWRPVFPLNEVLSAGGSHIPQVRPFAKKSV